MNASTALADIADKLAITELCHRYGIALDSHDWTMLRDCFLPDAIAHYGADPCTSYDEIEATCRAALDPLSASQHLIGNVLIELDGDRATSICYVQAQHVRVGLPGGAQFIFAGKYVDRHVRTSAGWRVAERRLEPMWTAGNPGVLA